MIHECNHHGTIDIYTGKCQCFEGFEGIHCELKIQNCKYLLDRYNRLYGDTAYFIQCRFYTIRCFILYNLVVKWSHFIQNFFDRSGNFTKYIWSFCDNDQL